MRDREAGLRRPRSGFTDYFTVRRVVMFALLLAVLTSNDVVVTVAELTITSLPRAVTFTCNFRVAVGPGAKLPAFHVRVPADPTGGALKLPWETSAWRYVVCCGLD